MRGGRTNWKIENPIFNTLKNQNYHFSHNFGHGYKNLSTIFATLLLLAFFVDQAQQLSYSAFQEAWKTHKSKIVLWEKMRSLFFCYYIDNWNDLFHALIHGPPPTNLKINSS